MTQGAVGIGGCEVGWGEQQVFPFWSPAGCDKVLPSFQIQGGDALWLLKEKGGNTLSLTGDCNLVFP